MLDAIAKRPGQRSHGTEPFPDIYSKAASIMEAIIRWHPFADGNKRTALVTVSAFLDINGYVLIIPLRAVRFTVLIARNTDIDSKSNTKQIRKIAKWLSKYSASKEDPDEIDRVFKKVRSEYAIYYYAGKSVIFRKLARLAVRAWLAVDIYPEYEHEIQDITSFLHEQLQHNIRMAEESRRQKP